MKTAKEIKEELEKEHGWNFSGEENMEMYYELFLDVQKVALRQPPVSGSLPCSKCGLGSHPVFGAQCMSNDCPQKGNDR